MIHYNDEAILKGILAGDKNILKYVYDWYFKTIRSLILRNNGNEQDAEDIFQDALVIIYQRVIDNELVLDCSFKTFLYSVCRHLWLQHLEKEKNPANIADIENHIELSDEMVFEIYDEQSEKYRLYQQHFVKLSKDCQKVLKLFYSHTPLKDIADIMGYKTEKYAKTRKYLCKENLRQRILSDPKCKKYLDQ
jgi:RNA polymerase sigma factor (sigma-70 family)